MRIARVTWGKKNAWAGDEGNLAELPRSLGESLDFALLDWRAALESLVLVLTIALFLAEGVLRRCSHLNPFWLAALCWAASAPSHWSVWPFSELCKPDDYLAKLLESLFIISCRLNDTLHRGLFLYVKFRVGMIFGIQPGIWVKREVAEKFWRKSSLNVRRIIW